MKLASITVGFCSAVFVVAFPEPTDLPQNQAGCDAPVSLNASTNIFKEYKLHPQIIYRRRAEVAAEVIADAELKSRALKVAYAGQFVWIRGRNSIKKIEEVVKDVPCDHVLGLVLDGLPLKTCPSHGFGPDKDPWDYRAEYLNPIVKIIQSHPNTAFALIVEPGVVSNVVTEGTKGACKQMIKSYRENVPYALRSLNLPNTVLYLDACHGGWFGWTDNQKPGAEELINVWKNAGEPLQFRGVAINVASYNSWDTSPGEMFWGETSRDVIDNPARNEQLYLQILKREVDKANVSMPFHSIMDTSRNAIIGIRREWSYWCNVKDAGFGIRPTAETGDSLLDAFVYAKGGGESDGTSDVYSDTYNSFCGNLASYKPMPEQDEWSPEYFEMLLKNAKLK